MTGLAIDEDAASSVRGVVIAARAAGTNSQIFRSALDQPILYLDFRYGSALHVLGYWHMIGLGMAFGGPVGAQSDMLLDHVLEVSDALSSVDMPLTDLYVRDTITAFTAVPSAQFPRGLHRPRRSEMTALSVSLGVILNSLQVSDADADSQFRRVKERIALGLDITKQQFAMLRRGAG